MNITFWKAAAIRAAKTFLQVILALWTAGTIITQVDWKFTLLSAVSAAVYSLLTSLLAGLPEVEATSVLESALEIDDDYDTEEDEDDWTDSDEEGEE